jgi:hypothetical protein
VDFPLDLDLPPLIVAGIAAARGEGIVADWQGSVDKVVEPAAAPPPKLLSAPWPPIVQRLLAVVRGPMPVDEVLAVMERDGSTAAETLHALEAALAAKLLAIAR